MNIYLGNKEKRIYHDNKKPSVVVVWLKLLSLQEQKCFQPWKLSL